MRHTWLACMIISRKPSTDSGLGQRGPPGGRREPGANKNRPERPDGARPDLYSLFQPLSERSPACRAGGRPTSSSWRSSS